MELNFSLPKGCKGLLESCIIAAEPLLTAVLSLLLRSLDPRMG